MKYFCTNCSYVYDEVIGDEKEGIKTGTLFSQLGEDFECPNCLEKNSFIGIKEEINNLDENNLSQIEKLHFPNYEIIEDKLFFHINHENSEENFIYKISLFDEYNELLEEIGFKNTDEIKGFFYINFLDDFEIRIFCSIDGIFSIKFKNP